MDLRDYIRVARRRWWMAAVSVVIAVGVATIVNMRMPAVHASSVTFFISTAHDDVAGTFEGGMFSQQRLSSYVELLTGERLAQSLATVPNVGLTADQIRERIVAEAVGDTVLLEVTVSDPSAQRSYLLARELVPRFTGLVESLEATTSGTSLMRVTVVAGPRLHDAPVSPQPVQNYALAVTVGLILGIGAAVVREVTDTTVKTAEALRDLAGAPVLARVPADPAARAGPAVPEGRRVEALRQLRTHLQYVDRDRPVRTLAVTSAMPGEGRTATACGLAALFAQAGRRVLIVDAELRRPRLATLLGLDGTAGLASVLGGTSSLDDALQPWGADLWLLSSGSRPTNPSELLDSPHMTSLLEELRGRFDLVILDCPPLLPVTDGAIVAGHTDGAILLAHARKTTAAQVTAAVQALRAVDARLLGCVLNMATGKGPDTYGDEEYLTKGSSGHRRAPRKGRGPGLRAALGSLRRRAGGADRRAVAVLRRPSSGRRPIVAAPQLLT